MPVSVLTESDFVPKTPEAARAAFAKKAALTADVFERLSTAAKQKAFRIAGVNNARLIQAVRNRIAASIKRGTTWAEVRKEITKLFDVAGEELPGLGRLRQTFITNTQQAYNDARRELFEQETGTFPFWQYLTVGNGTAGVNGVRATHAALHGLIFRAEDPFWNSHYPPWDFNCRCYVVALTEGQARGAGQEPRNLSFVRRKLRIGPNEAFERSGPTDVKGIDAELREALEEMLR